VLQILQRVFLLMTLAPYCWYVSAVVVVVIIYVYVLCNVLVVGEISMDSRNTMGSSAYGSAGASGQFDPAVFIRKPQVILRMIGFVSVIWHYASSYPRSLWHRSRTLLHKIANKVLVSIMVMVRVRVSY